MAKLMCAKRGKIKHFRLLKRPPFCYSLTRNIGGRVKTCVPSGMLFLQLQQNQPGCRGQNESFCKFVFASLSELNPKNKVLVIGIHKHIKEHDQLCRPSALGCWTLFWTKVHPTPRIRDSYSSPPSQKTDLIVDHKNNAVNSTDQEVKSACRAKSRPKGPPARSWARRTHRLLCSISYLSPKL